MKRIYQSIIGLLLVLAVLFSIFIPVFAESGKTATVLFTHDLHSHFLPSVKEGGGEFGGCARLMTAIREQRAK